MVDFEERAKALADYLGIPVESVEIEDDPYDDARCEYTTPDGVYNIMDYDEAMEAVEQDAESLMDDIGLESFAPDFRDWVIDNAISGSDWFEDACREMEESYAYDIAYEYDDEYGTRLAQECVEAGIIDDDDFEDGEYVGDLDLASEYADYLFDRIDRDYGGNFYQWYVDDFGNDAVTHLIRDGRVNFDMAKIAEEMVKWDGGFGNTLAGYDGRQIELDKDGYIEFYAFRVN